MFPTILRVAFWTRCGASRGLRGFPRVWLGTYTASRKDLLASAEKVFSMVGKGEITVDIRQRFALAEVVQAHRDLESGHTKGSSILTP